MIEGEDNITVVGDSAVSIVNDTDKIMLDDGQELYTRQSSMGLYIPSSVLVIGAGGVGSWVAINLALCGVLSIAILDHDVVDVSNLNRTLFKADHVGSFKVHAVKELIAERRMICDVLAIAKKYEDLTVEENKFVNGNYECVVDCRDSIAPLKGVRGSPIVGGYNGLNGTVHINPNFKKVFGPESTGYTIIPSYAMVPQVLAAVIVNYICAEKHQDREKIINVDFKTLTRKLEKRITKKKKDISDISAVISDDTLAGLGLGEDE
jgi:hypothetical protein